MNPLDTAEIGSTGVRVTRLALGGAPIGGLLTNVAEDAAVQTVQRAWRLGVRYFDTAPLYGRGLSETRCGLALAAMPRNEFVLSTKVGRLLVPAETGPVDDQWPGSPALRPVFDFSRDGGLRSLEESLGRLGLDRVDIALVHDLDIAAAEDPEHYRRGVDEAYPALAELRSQGVIKAVGAGLNSSEPLFRLAEEADFDCFLLAGRYTLLDQSGLAELLPLCERKGISVILGGPYNSGILASDLSPGATFDYAEAPPDILERARRIGAVCARHAVPLKAAALQFGLAHPAVAATIPGARSAAEVEENVGLAGHPIPDDLWTELRRERLIPEAAPTPVAPRRL